MEKEKVGKFNLKRKTKKNIASSNRTFLLFHERFLSYLKEKKPELLSKYISKLISRYKSEAKRNYLIIDQLDIAPIKEKISLILEHQELINACVNLHLSLYKIPEDFSWDIDETEVLHINADRAHYSPRYYAFEVLIKMIDREEAIQFLKEFTDYYVENYREVSRYEKLRTIFEDDVKRGRKSDSSIFTVGLVNEGKYVGKTEKCMGFEALSHLEDREITDLVLCYGDFTLIKKLNENFVATRTITLPTGPYCDICVHDTRIVKEIEHP
ncbi:MAG: hypothetical protein FK732_05340, partial [Asgard group archaeon]|nr:hypothetical protein [Asgard group archaeon]